MGIRARPKYGTLHAWNKECDPAASKPCYDTLEDQTRKREAIYWRHAPPDERIPLPRRAPCALGYTTHT